MNKERMLLISLIIGLSLISTSVAYDSLTIVSTKTTKDVLFVVSNQNYTTNATMQFSEIVVDTSDITFNDTTFEVVSPNNIAIALDTLKQAPAWWNTSFSKSKTYVINPNMIDETLSNFPVLVKIDSTTGALCDDGNSIRFISPDNQTEYPYEIDTWNNSGTSFVWVKIPTVSNTTNTRFLMYYNNSNAVDGETPTEVWDDNYVYVNHFGYDYNDSTGNAPTTTNTGVTFIYDDVCGMSGSFYPTDRLRIPSYDKLNVSEINLNVIGNVRDRDTATYGCFISKSYASQYEFRWLSWDGYFEGKIGGTQYNDITLTHNFITEGSYANYLITYENGENMKFYRDTVYKDDITINGGYFNTSTSPMYVGYRSADVSFDGNFTELRISNITRSDAWNDAVYSSVMDYDNFTIETENHDYADSTPRPLAFYAETSAGNVSFNISGFMADTRYDVIRGGSTIASRLTDANGVIRFTNDVWSEQHFYINSNNIIDVAVVPSVWQAGNIELGENAQNNFTFYQNGTASLDISIGYNTTNYSFVSYSAWKTGGNNQVCANYTADVWLAESNIAPGYPPSTGLKVDFESGNFVFGNRLWAPRTTLGLAQLENFDIVLTVQEHT